MLYVLSFDSSRSSPHLKFAPFCVRTERVRRAFSFLSGAEFLACAASRITTPHGPKHPSSLDAHFALLSDDVAHSCRPQWSHSWPS